MSYEIVIFLFIWLFLSIFVLIGWVIECVVRRYAFRPRNIIGKKLK